MLIKRMIVGEIHLIWTLTRGAKVFCFSTELRKDVIGALPDLVISYDLTRRIVAWGPSDTTAWVSTSTTHI